MTFTSVVFLVFLAVVLPLYFVSKHRVQNLLLLVASYFFYGWWDYRFLSLLALSTVIDYIVAKSIAGESRDSRRAYLLGLSVCTNLGCLGFFKYYGFFTDSAARLLSAVGFETHLPTLSVILPVGISFYTFQSLSYTIDVYRRRLLPVSSFTDFALYVSFFPQLVAGPIERATHLLPQIQNRRIYDAESTANGVALIVFGYVKKLVIADRLAPIVNAAFVGDHLPFDDAGNWVFLYAFALQIYGDFSGYSDIARGLSKLMGFDLMVNFNRPYLVSSPSEFWRHWHISLSTWLRDYLYIPLGGNRCGELRRNVNLMTTMLLGGLWHGAGWAFVIWGGYHGFLLVLFAAARPIGDWAGRCAGRVPFGAAVLRVISVCFFFHLTCIGWLFFRVGTMPDLGGQFYMIKNSLTTLLRMPNSLEVIPFVVPVLWLGGLSFWLQIKHDAIERFDQWSTTSKVVAMTVCLYLITALGVFDGSQFIYFQF